MDDEKFPVYTPSLGRRPTLQNKDNLSNLVPVMSMDGKAVGTDANVPTTWKQRLRVYMVNEGPRIAFVSVYWLVHALVFAFGFMNYWLKDNLQQARNVFLITYPIARSAALVLHVDIAIIMITVCRSFISVLRRGPLNNIIPFEKNITFHKLIAWTVVFFTAVHIIAHMVNFTLFGLRNTNNVGQLLLVFVEANFITGPGATGWIMTAALAVMVWYAVEKRRRKNFEKFWYSHHLFIVFFIAWQLHGMFCMIPQDRDPFCPAATIGLFWRYWFVGGIMYTIERGLREWRGYQNTEIVKVTLHPSNVVEIQMRKDSAKTRAGQYIFLCCPAVSLHQWHPFTLTSAPEEDYISVHIRVVGDFTKALAQVLGCDMRSPEEKAEGALDDKDSRPASQNLVLPRLMIDGPFGSASEDVFKFEVALLVGAGIGVTPFASILKSVWYRMNIHNPNRPTRVHKIYFFWICRDTAAFEWFQSLLAAIEEQDVDNKIEIHTYLTKPLKDNDMANIYVSDIGADMDPVTKLVSPTHYGRPNWDLIFEAVAQRHPTAECGVFFCGPKPLGSQLHKQCNKHTSGKPNSVKFRWGKENF